MTYTNKTVATKVSPREFIQTQKESLRHDALLLVSFYEKVTGAKCVMWNRIFGFGEYEYKDSKGGSHTYLAAGFAVSSTGFTLYNIMGWEKYKDELAHLGKYKLSGKSCLAIKQVSDIDLKVLEKVTKLSLKDLKSKYSVRLK